MYTSLFVAIAIWPLVFAVADPAPLNAAGSTCLRGCLQNTALANFTQELRDCLAKPNVTDATVCFCDTGELLDSLGHCVVNDCGSCLNRKRNQTCTTSPAFDYLRDICPAAARPSSDHRRRVVHTQAGEISGWYEGEACLAPFHDFSQSSSRYLPIRTCLYRSVAVHFTFPAAIYVDPLLAAALAFAQFAAATEWTLAFADLEPFVFVAQMNIRPVRTFHVLVHVSGSDGTINNDATAAQCLCNLIVCNESCKTLAPTGKTGGPSPPPTYCGDGAFVAFAATDAQCLQNCVRQAASNNTDAAVECSKAVDSESLRCVCSSEVLVNAMNACVRDNCDAKVSNYFQLQCAGLTIERTIVEIVLRSARELSAS
ncbi:hypothetical protein AURDEDRAFT_163783 [Auricularia subglabra TFB-10046 SS5]|nr:hypothetical protein AURDEDRAFT_163783 [Auricularia subglabra TFB-10046 SS5]